MPEHSPKSEGRKRRRGVLATRDVRDGERRRRESDRLRREEEHRRHEMRVQRLVEDAVVRTEKIDHRTQKLNFLLKASLSKIPGPFDFDSLKEDVPELDLGVDAEPLPVPQWETYAPRPAGLVDRLLHHGAEHRHAVAQAEKAFTNALERYRRDESARKSRIERMRRAHEDAISQTHKQILEQNAEVEDLEQRVLAGDRQGVSEYFQRAVAPLVDKPPFRNGRRFGYIPESRLLVVEWDLPDFDIVPREKEYRYNKHSDQVEVYKWRPISEVRETYRDLLAQMALRAIKAVFSADPNWLVETVVFNGVLPAPAPTASDDDQIDEQLVPIAHGPVCLISMRATRHSFHRLDLKEIEPLETVRKRFSAKISRYPDEFVEVDPLLPYELADPELDASSRVPALDNAEPEQFERLMTDLLDRMGFETELRDSADGMLDFLVSLDSGHGKQLQIVRVRQTGPVADPADVRELHHTVRRERAEFGVLLITGGFDPRSFEYANGKALQLIDGPSLLALCREYEISLDLDTSAEPAIDAPTTSEALSGEPDEPVEPVDSHDGHSHSDSDSDDNRNENSNDNSNGGGHPDDVSPQTTTVPQQRLGGGLPLPSRISR